MKRTGQNIKPFLADLVNTGLNIREEIRGALNLIQYSAIRIGRKKSPGVGKRKFPYIRVFERGIFFLGKVSLTRVVFPDCLGPVTATIGYRADSCSN